MDFTTNTTKEKRPLYHMCFKKILCGWHKAPQPSTPTHSHTLTYHTFIFAVILINEFYVVLCSLDPHGTSADSGRTRTFLPAHTVYRVVPTFVRGR
jgi:hypothetical protein